MKAYLLIAIGYASVFCEALLAEGGQDLTYKETNKSIDMCIGADPYILEFPYKNDGEGIIQVISIDPSCSCLSVQSAPELVEPGAAGVIRIRASSPKVTGRAFYNIKICTFSDKPRESVLTVEIRTNEIFLIKPEILIWLPGEAGVEKELKIYSKLSEFKCLKVELNAEHFDLKATSGGQANGEYTYRISPKGGDVRDELALVSVAQSNGMIARKFVVLRFIKK